LSRGKSGRGACYALPDAVTVLLDGEVRSHLSAIESFLV
jgi:hypothetical protein